ncbi:MAG: BMP family ABC transporter substrate-binding protein [Alphaproteobacteria bacterium]|jgi:simple sugar transport system substrate-binding protein|nr:BMP family ABC transporter substrate-binding protein [Alphaproteobacteria bacterium]MDP6813657.1 BMP family ABC transporter substrate-binding protein [Alphaproteobacteria bacterium]
MGWLGAAALALALNAGTALADPTKVGFVYVGPIGDHGWTYRHDIGRKAIEKAFGAKVKTTFVESVKEGADAERVIRKLASTGHKLIFTTSFGYMNPTVKVAKSFPDVRFEHATGYKQAGNVSTYMARFYEGRHIAGLIAGKMTKSNVIGYIGSFPIPEVVRGINAFTLALRQVNPKATVKVVWVNTWYDPGKEGAAAKALIDQGADVILQHTDSPAPVQAAQERGVWAVGQASDMTHFGPKSHLTAIVDVWDGYYVDRTRAVMDGNWKSGDTWGGLKDGMLAMAPYNPALPADVLAMAKQAEADIMSGKVHPFQGPIRDQAGKEKVPAGKSLDDGALLSMNWYVEGVQGKLPK